MTKYNPSPLSRLADEFMSSAGVMENGTAFAEKLNNALTPAEESNVTNGVLKTLAAAQGDDQAMMDRQTLRLANIFAKAAGRIAAEDEAAGFVPVALTTATTEQELVDAGAADFAKIVGIARAKNPQP